jgi:hypothetical protein
MGMNNRVVGGHSLEMWYHAINMNNILLLHKDSYITQ